jgi:DNA-binding transcriptional regulator YiaG
MYSLSIMTGSALRKIRQHLALTQAQLAEQLGVTSNTVARWERDEVRITEPMTKLIQLLSGQKER